MDRGAKEKSMGTYTVTGTASGMGAATRSRLLAAGHRVIGIDLREADIEVDLSTPEGRRHAIEKVREECGGVLDGLITYAGIAGITDRPGSLLVGVNYFGTVELLDGLRTQLAAAEAPAAIAISSNSTTTTPGISQALIDTCLAGDEAAARVIGDKIGSLNTYPSTKTAVARWVRRHAPQPDWIGAGITLNAIVPGVTGTAMIEEVRQDPNVGPQFDAFPVPAGRPCDADEVAALAVFLLGPDARFFCGSLLFVDGGTDALLRPDDWPSPFVLPD